MFGIFWKVQHSNQVQPAAFETSFAFRTPSSYKPPGRILRNVTRYNSFAMHSIMFWGAGSDGFTCDSLEGASVHLA